MDPTKKRTLPRVDLELSEISYGSAPIGNRFGVIDELEAQALIEAAWEAGTRYFDTAPSYGHGLAEHRLGHAMLAHSRAEYVLSTKLGRTLVPSAAGSFDSGPWVNVPPMRADFDYSYSAASQQLHESLHRMMVDRVDIVYLHDADGFIHGGDYEQRLREATEGTLPAMVRMREEGVVAAVGAGLNTARALFDVVSRSDLDCLLVAGRYTLLEQADAKPVMDLCAERGVAVILGGVFNTGILATGAKQGARFDYGEAPSPIALKTARLQETCDEFGVSLPAAAIQFGGAHPAVVSVCLGSRTMAQQVANYAYAEEAIPSEFWGSLRSQGLIEDWAPTPS